MSTSIPTGEADRTRRPRLQLAAARARRLATYSTPDAEELLVAGEARLTLQTRQRRDQVTSAIAAGLFLIVAIAMAAADHSSRSLAPGSLLLAAGFYGVSRRVRFPVGAVWAYPSQLAFVPLLFLVPTSVVPLVVAATSVLARVPDVLRGRRGPSWFISDIGDCWYVIGPALVLTLAHAEHFAWTSWPTYVGALAAQLAFDCGATLAICWFAEGIRPGKQLPLIWWTYVIDISLSTVGLVIAAEAVLRPPVLMLVMPLLGVLVLFARERQAHLRQSVVLSSAYRGTTFLLADVIEADDGYTGEHSHGVLQLSLAVAKALGLDSTSQRNVEFAALLHDIGKINVPKEIINKPGPLDDQEWRVIRRHTVEGEAMLNKVGGGMVEVGRIVRASHEHYDGNGYPDRLAGEEIPIEARVVTACDAYSAMTTDRSYRRARTPAAALAELRACSGTQFDPCVVDAIHDVVIQQCGTVAQPHAELRVDRAAFAAS